MKYDGEQNSKIVMRILKKKKYNPNGEVNLEEEKMI